MILEAVMINVLRGLEDDFEASFLAAQKIIVGSPGYISHELHRCLEHPNRYLLLVRWETVEANIDGFRKSDEYRRWKALLHPYYDPFPEINYFTTVTSAGQSEFTSE